VISVDAKKRELVGNFKNAGATWGRTPTPVNDHDFRSQAEGGAILYGIFDPQANRGSLFVGVSHETSAFAVSSIRAWWRHEGRQRYANSKHLLILADTGGSNSAARGAWKDQLQQLCDGTGLTITVAHYPTGASKYNPIERRLFSAISRNWAGEPLQNYEKILKFIRTTTTTAGLKVRAVLDRPPPERLSGWRQALRRQDAGDPHHSTQPRPALELHNHTLECEVIVAPMLSDRF
jgi:hypothetical protein